MTQHVSGPWVEDVAADGTIVAECDDGQKIIICVVGDPNCDMSKFDRADMHLIMAAPEMLDALEAAETMLRCLPDTSTNANGTRPNMTTRAALRIVRAALTKARP